MKKCKCKHTRKQHYEDWVWNDNIDDEVRIIPCEVYGCLCSNYMELKNGKRNK